MDFFVPSRPAAELCGAAFARHLGRAYTTVKNAVPDINVLKRAALRDKALTAMRDLASGAQFIDQVSARHVSIVIGIRPDLVKSLISAELDCTRASLRVRRKGRKGGNFRLADGLPTVDASLMREPFFFEGGVEDLATDTGLSAVPEGSSRRQQSQPTPGPCRRSVGGPSADAANGS